ncbi:hypothetical protein N5079_29745 [Planotetraspora sp. A-T 1434]|uniref:hypothetical protein n=1 Tax=Planotetraspora sp. A-T 1434 TaxID=2979219 RepID=UPI0021C051A3|nr:hypothetical protein [Planotetraspora sp. A-T 1434]MCT9934396.1 hypothetical protein [Planotetraspora sp. A-T 1434]
MAAVAPVTATRPSRRWGSSSALPIFLVVALFTSAGASLMRSLALDADQRRHEAEVARVELSVGDSAVRISVRDDGIGGADPRQRVGPRELRDRVQAIGGRMEVTSPAGAGTSLVATVPLGAVPLGAVPLGAAPME